MTRDISDIATPEEHDKALVKTLEAIARAEEALKAGFSPVSLAQLEKLNKERDELEQLKLKKGW